MSSEILATEDTENTEVRRISHEGDKGIRGQGHKSGRRAMTLKETGKKFGLTRERIRQLRRYALIKLRFS
jgi:DNA-directed RNA polymerase sigma subunit (sigma70/sigma32)